MMENVRSEEGLSTVPHCASLLISKPFFSRFGHILKIMEKQRSAILLVLLLLLIFAGWWSVSLYHIAPSPQQQVAATSVSLPIDTTYIPASSLEIQSAFSNGAQSYNGTLLLPDCDTFSTAISTSGSNPAHVTLAFEVLRYDGSCHTASSTPNPFSASVSTGAIEPILQSVTVNNQTIPFSLIQAQ
jgi:hypothetical protein